MSRDDKPGDTNNPAEEAYQPRTRQELYDMIRESSKTSVIRQEMIRYGFWPKSRKIESEDPEEQARIEELASELGKVRTELSKLHDLDKLIARARKERMEESRRRQAETKERREREREAKAAAWKEAQEKDVVYLGEGVSGGLGGKESDAAKLEAAGLPVFNTALDVAQAMGIGLGELRYLSYHRKVAKTTHYVRFRLPKKTGGTRLISAPMPRLKAAQHWVLQNVLDRVTVHEAAHGFRHERSIVTNAEPHVGRAIVVNVDLKDFFPTVTYGRVKGMFKQLGYSEQVSTVLGLLCTEPDVTSTLLDGETYHIAQTPRYLPQGGPTSPAVTNIICRRLDARLAGLAKALGFTYTRYADDLTFSTDDASAPCGKLLKALRGIVGDEDFVVHPDKTRIFRSGRRQEVTGVVVNEKLSVSRKTLRAFRATLYQIEQDGPEGKIWGTSDDLFAAIEGYANFVHMVNAEKGKKFVDQVKRIRQKHDPSYS